MPDLKALQAAFQDHLLKGDDAVLQYLTDTPRAPAEQRLAIYHNAYRARLVEALAGDYAQLQKLLGAERFSQLCHAYISEHPSHYFSLRWFGRQMPAFLGYAEEPGSHDWPAEMAGLEWAFTESFDAADAELVTEADAAVIPAAAWPGLIVAFHPSVRCLILWWNTPARWRAAKREQKPPQPLRLPEPTACLLWRQALTTQFRTLAADETVALRAAMAGASFAEICGALAETLQDQEQVPMRAAGFLKGWLASDMVAELNV